MSTFIQDSVHGYIKLTDEEEKIIDTPEFQRLRRIKQLGLSSLVYPSATHNRFQHSIGVMHIAGKFSETLNLDDHKKRELRIAGLLHDIGHGPFSHASEVLAEQKGFSHEDLSCKIVDDLGSRFSFDTDRVKRMINGELEIGRIIAGDVDSDRMDYLQRDAHATGVNYGNIDADTIIRLAEIDSRRLVFDHKCIPALESLLTARFHMTKSVYLHKTCLIADKMLERALQNFVKENGINELMRMDDYQAHVRLLEQDNGLYRDLSERKLFKNAISLDQNDLNRDQLENLSKSSKKDIESEIKSISGVDDVLVDLPSIPSNREFEIRVKRGGEVHPMSELSSIPSSLNEAEWQLSRIGVYCRMDNTDAVKEASRNVLL